MTRSRLKHSTKAGPEYVPVSNPNLRLPNLPPPFYSLLSLDFEGVEAWLLFEMRAISRNLLNASRVAKSSIASHVLLKLSPLQKDSTSPHIESWNEARKARTGTISAFSSPTRLSGLSDIEYH